jgi:hypothetical protein
MFLVSIIALGLIICLSGLENEVKNGVHGREKKAGIHYFLPPWLGTVDRPF